MILDWSVWLNDHRNRSGRRGPVEPVAEADLDLVFREIVPHGKKAARGEHSVERKVRGVAEIRVAVLGPHPPIVGDGIFDAAASRPTSTRVRKAGKVPGTPVKNPAVSVRLVLKLLKATPPVP